MQTHFRSENVNRNLLGFTQKSKKNKILWILIHKYLYICGIQSLKMIKRTLESVLRKKIDYKKAIILFGPRQVGKTTLVKAVMQEFEEDCLYFNGDDIATRSLWDQNNVAALKQSFGNKKLIVLDEAQRVENVGLICKQIIDADTGLQLILTGSSALNMADLTQEPLTGRKWEYLLLPISCSELAAYKNIPELIRLMPQQLVFGNYPEVVMDMNHAPQILSNLTSSYLYKDILALTGIKKPQLLDKILKALAWQLGSEVSLNELAGLTGADVKTVDHYIYLLEQAFVLYRLGTFSRNLRNEINTKKKIYFYDNGIRNALIGNYSSIGNRNDTGALWENYLLAERKKLLAYNGFYGQTYFWRNTAQAEIDYVEEIDGKLYAYEFKWNPKTKVKFPKAFVESYKPQVTRVIHRDNFWQWLMEYPYS